MAAAPHRVLEESALPVAGMRVVRVGKTNLLLVREANGTVRAVQPLCPHYQMPLSDGLVCGSAVHCSWHQSRFDLGSGAVLEPPALSPLTTYPVRVADGWIDVTPVPETKVSSTRAVSDETIVLLGGGAAGQAAALRLRELGFGGRVVQIMGEPSVPYDRPNLSKEHLSGAVSPGDLPLPRAEVVRVHRRAVGVDPDQRAIRFEDRSSLQYDRLLIASGSVPVPLDVPGAGLRNVFTLRSRSDGERLMTAARGARRAVVVGSSFIGMEVAAALRERGLAVTVVTPERVPFARVLGPEVGGYFRALHHRSGVRFRLRSNVQRVVGDTRVRAVVLDSGERLAADLVVVGIGVRPATAWLPPAWRNSGGRVPVSGDLSVPGTDHRVFAAGDIAVYPDPLGGDTLHVEHWRVAEQQGRRAAENVLAAVQGRQAEPFRAVPYFWSYQLGQGLDYVGHARDWDEVIIHGDLPGGDFTAYYRQGDHVPAAASVGRSLQMTALLEWMTRHGTPSIADVQSDPDWVELLRREN